MAAKKAVRREPTLNNTDAEMARRLGKSQANGEAGSGTTPEFVLEGALMMRGVNYRTQIELGFTRPDGVVFNGDGTATALYVDGDHWHKDGHGHDVGKVTQALGFEVEGHVITQGVRVLESDIQSLDMNEIVDAALRGEQWRELV